MIGTPTNDLFFKGKQISHYTCTAIIVTRGTAVHFNSFALVASTDYMTGENLEQAPHSVKPLRDRVQEVTQGRKEIAYFEYVCV